MALGLYAVGRHLTLVSLTPQNVNAVNGVVTPGTTTIITGLVDELDPEETVTTEEISPITTFRENHVAIMVGTRMRVVEILTQQASVYGTLGPQLPLLRNTLLAGSGVCVVSWIHGGNADQFLGVYSGMGAPWRGKGKQIMSMNFMPVDNGVFNWLQAV